MHQTHAGFRLTDADREAFRHIRDHLLAEGVFRPTLTDMVRWALKTASDTIQQRPQGKPEGD